jgi:uncharacterized protein (TIGR02271 family)
MKTIVGLFDNFSEAQAVVRDLERAGFDRTNVSVVTNEDAGRAGTGSRTGDADDADTSTAEGAASGAVIGGVTGGVAGLLAGLAGLAIPGIGPVLAAGPLVAALTGAGIGAVTGGLIGALVSAGVPEEHARYYEEGIRRGGTLVTVTASDERADEVMDIMNRHNPIDIEERAAQWRAGGFTAGQSGATGTTAATGAATGAAARTTETRAKEGEQHIPVVEEELRVGKRQVERGGIRAYARTTETPVEEQVTLREEHVRVERRPVDRPATAGDIDEAFREGTIEVTERAEEAVVQKQARVVEEVVIGKEATERTETVRDTVRRTDVEVQPVGGQAAGGGFEGYEEDFRSNFQQSFPGDDYTYDQVKPVYRYGQSLASENRGADWDAIEPRARSRWEERNPGTWDKFKNAARYAWDKTRDKVT